MEEEKDVAEEEGREFKQKGTKGADRPVGEYPSDQAGAAPSKPIDEDMPEGPPT